MALEAVPLGRLFRWFPMALLTSLHSGQKYIRGFVAFGCACVTGCAGHHPVSRVVEGCMRKPAFREIRLRNLRQRTRKGPDRMALLARLRPQ